MDKDYGMIIAEEIQKDLNESVVLGSLALIGVGALMGAMLHSMLTATKTCEEAYDVGTGGYSFCMSKRYKLMADKLEQAKESCKTSEDEKGCKKKFEKAIDLLFAHSVRQEILGKKLVIKEKDEKMRIQQIEKEKRKAERLKQREERAAEKAKKQKEMDVIERSKDKRMTTAKAFITKNDKKLRTDIKKFLK